MTTTNEPAYLPAMQQANEEQQTAGSCVRHTARSEFHQPGSCRCESLFTPRRIQGIDGMTTDTISLDDRSGVYAVGVDVRGQRVMLGEAYSLAVCESWLRTARRVLAVVLEQDAAGRGERVSA